MAPRNTADRRTAQATEQISLTLFPARAGTTLTLASACSGGHASSAAAAAAAPGLAPSSSLGIRRSEAARCRALELASYRRVGPVLQRSHTNRCDALSHTDSSLVEQQQQEEEKEEEEPPLTRFDEACASLEAGAGVTLGTMKTADPTSDPIAMLPLRAHGQLDSRDEDRTVALSRSAARPDAFSALLNTPELFATMTWSLLVDRISASRAGAASPRHRCPAAELPPRCPAAFRCKVDGENADPPVAAISGIENRCWRARLLPLCCWQSAPAARRCVWFSFSLPRSRSRFPALDPRAARP